MLTSFSLSVAVGLLLGCLSGLGIGGGSLLILWLTNIAKFPPEQARAINLIFFIPCAFISSCIRFRSNKQTLSSIWPAAVLGCLSAFLISFLSRQWDTDLLKKGFGLYVLISGIRELRYKKASI